jgi:hypothetical protein
MRRLLVIAFAGVLAGALIWGAEPETSSLLTVRRIYVEKLAGDQSAVQIRDMIINTLQSSNVFVITENAERADATLKGSAEDLVFTDTFQSSDSINARASLGSSTTSSAGSPGRRGALSVGVGQDESTKISERKHEAMAAVRLVNKDGEVIWATTQESLGAKFRGASADVADKVVKQLIADVAKVRNPIASRPAGQ